jgi:hypothetical protein
VQTKIFSPRRSPIELGAAEPKLGAYRDLGSVEEPPFYGFVLNLRRLIGGPADRRSREG